MSIIKQTRATVKKSRALTEASTIGKLDAYDQAQLVKKKEISPCEIIAAAQLRIEALNPEINVLSHERFNAAQAQAEDISLDQEMPAVPYLLKDGVGYRGLPTYNGSRSRIGNVDPIIEYDYTKQLDKAGLIPLGKTNVPEFGLLPTTESLFYGPAKNPWSTNHSTGGSSGGAAAAVAAGMVPFAHAADGGGSIRIPASCCGVFGFKPSRGANVRARKQDIIEDFLVQDSLISRTVRDAAWGVQQCHPQSLSLVNIRQIPSLKIAIISEGLLGAQPASIVGDTITKTADLCTSLGHQVSYEKLPIDGPAVSQAFKTIWGYMAHGIVSSYDAEIKSETLMKNFEPWTIDLARWAEGMHISQLEQVYYQANLATMKMNAFFEKYDLILSPVLNDAPLALGVLSPTVPFDDLMHKMFDYVSYTLLHNLTGTPSMSVPLHTPDQNLPIGSLFSAKQGNDALLFALAFQLEKALPWKDRWPDISIRKFFSENL
jgi:amidase